MVTVRKRRDKTGGELGMQEPHSESLANYAELESCAGGGDIAGKALTEALPGRLSSRETSFQAPTSWTHGVGGRPGPSAEHCRLSGRDVLLHVS